MTAAWTRREYRFTGTGRVADDLYLIGHDDRTGKPRLPPRPTGLALAGALLADLVLARQAVIAPDAVTAVGEGDPADELATRILRQIRAERRAHPAAMWLTVVSRTATDDVAARLAQDGYLNPQPARWPRRTGRWVPANPDWTVMAISRGRAAMDPGRRAGRAATALTALAAAAGLGQVLVRYAPPGSHGRPDDVALALPEDLRLLVAAVRTAIDAAVLTRHT